MTAASLFARRFGRARRQWRNLRHPPRRGFAPGALPLPDGLREAPILAMGGELKSTFCLVKDGDASVAPYGDLEEARTLADFDGRSISTARFTIIGPKRSRRSPSDYLSTKLGRRMLPTRAARRRDAASSRPCRELPCRKWRIRERRPVLGLALDGSALAMTARFGRRVPACELCRLPSRRTFKPVAMLGGAQAMREPAQHARPYPRRNGWSAFAANFGELALYDFLKRSRSTLSQRYPQGSMRRWRVPAAAVRCGRAAIGFVARPPFMRAKRDAARALVDATPWRLSMRSRLSFGIPNLKGSDFPI